jgi:hypothetical protein
MRRLPSSVSTASRQARRTQVAPSGTTPVVPAASLQGRARRRHPPVGLAPARSASRRRARRRDSRCRLPASSPIAKHAPPMPPPLCARHRHWGRRAAEADASSATGSYSDGRADRRRAPRRPRLMQVREGTRLAPRSRRSCWRSTCTRAPQEPGLEWRLRC